jgi:NADH-quinone oxidoreductase subunit C
VTGVAEFAAGLAGAALSDAYGLPTLDVAPEHWRAAVTAARDRLGLTFFDWLSAVDELDAGFRIVVHLANLTDRQRLLLRTLVPREAARVDSLADVFAGAAWHERETAEMFGITFPGHPGLEPLLLPDGFEGNPLRKEFLLAARQNKPWPGAKEPGESDADLATPRRRRRNTPPGVPSD